MTGRSRPDAPSLLVADSHVLLAEAIASAATRGGYGKIFVVSDLDGLIRALNTGFVPSVFLLDLELVKFNDFEPLADVESRAPGIPIVVMLRDSEIEDMNLIVRAFIQGALGLVSKERGVGSLLRVLEVVRDGEAAIPRSMARAVVDALRFGPALMAENAGLSPRQRQVLALVTRGMTDRQIARQLEITSPTVRSHLEAIFEKTRTVNRTAAARWASVHLSENDSTLTADN